MYTGKQIFIYWTASLEFGCRSFNGFKTLVSHPRIYIKKGFVEKLGLLAHEDQPNTLMGLSLLSIYEN